MFRGGPSAFFFTVVKLCSERQIQKSFCSKIILAMHFLLENQKLSTRRTQICKKKNNV